MARNRSLIALALVAACSKSEPPDPPPVKPAEPTGPDAACAAKIAKLAPWLEQLELEKASHEIDFGYSLQVIDRTPLPVLRKIDALIVKEKSFDGYDLNGTEHERIEIDDVPMQTALEAKLAQMFATKPDTTDKRRPPPDLLRIDVAPSATWGNVVRVVDAAVKAGYTRAMFAFTATSKLDAPLGVLSKITDPEEISRANRRMEEMREKQCTPWDRALLRHVWNPDQEANARAVAKATSDAIAACNCAADPDEVRVLKWKDSHWHQATIRVPVVVSLVGASPTVLTASPKTPWSEAHVKIVGAAGATVRLVAK